MGLIGFRDAGAKQIMTFRPLRHRRSVIELQHFLRSRIDRLQLSAALPLVFFAPLRRLCPHVMGVSGNYENLKETIREGTARIPPRHISPPSLISDHPPPAIRKPK